MPITSNVTHVISRIQERINAMKPDSAELHAAFTRIGVVIASQTQINIRQRQLIDTGRLINSIRYEFYKDGDVSGIKIGSFGVPYAAVHEFGFSGVVSVREHKRLMTKAFGRDIPAQQVTVKPHERFARIKARPYLRPAVRKHQNLAINLLREALHV